jgi:phosphohistidine swiveling domain-containing protein
LPRNLTPPDYTDTMKWKKVISREYSVQYCEVALHAIGEKAKKYLPFCMKKQFVIPDHKNECFYVNETEFAQFIQSVIEKYSGSSEKFRHFVELFHTLGKDYVAFCKQVQVKDVTTLSNEDMKKIYLQYQEHLLNYSCIGAWMGFLLNEHWTEQGRKMMTIEDDQIREALFRPSKKSTVIIMQDESREIKGDKRKVKEFWERYQWIQSLDIHKTPWTLQGVKEYVQDIRQKSSFESISFGDACKKAGLTAEQNVMFEMIRELAYIRDMRDDYRRQGIFAIREFFIEIGKRMGVTIKEVPYFTEAELCSFLDGENVDVSKGKTRKANGFMLYLEGTNAVLVENNIDEALAKIGFIDSTEQVTEIKGLCASKGKASGRVAIVRTIHDILKVKKGDVLVAVTTHPDYVPAMQKAVAIVTEEGGILCHAAIVSRELGIPCVVGAKIATKVLDYGMIVEVNADKGIVNIIT